MNVRVPHEYCPETFLGNLAFLFFFQILLASHQSVVYSVLNKFSTHQPFKMKIDYVKDICIFALLQI